METAATIPAGRHTWEEFLALPDDDRRELLDGDYVEVEVPTLLHEWIVSVLLMHLMNWVVPRRAGLVIGSGYKVRVAEKRAVVPDLQYFKRPAGLPAQGLDGGRPDLAVEVISPSSVRIDRIRKLADYAAIGVPEYWLVDPQHRTFERLVLREAHYSIAEALADEAVFRPAEMQGLEIPLGTLWTLPEQG